MRIHCDTCGNHWDIFKNDNWKREKARTCPYCGRIINKMVWNSEILPAFGHVCDANQELYKSFLGFGDPSFSVDFMA